MKTIYYTATSLDGYIADADNSLDWLFQFPAPGEDYHAFVSTLGAVVMGSTTYEWMLRHVVHPEADRAQPWPWKQPVWVFTSRELPAVPDVDVHFVRGDVTPVHAEMVAAAGGGNIWVVGGGDLAGQFHDAGLLDEMVITIAPVTLGGGAPLFPRRIAKPPLRLVETRVVAEAMVELRFEVQRVDG